MDVARFFEESLIKIGSRGAKGAELAKMWHSEARGPMVSLAKSKAGADLLKMGRKRALYGAGAVAGLGVLGRSSGSRGLSPRSSAPPPSDPYRGY